MPGLFALLGRRGPSEASDSGRDEQIEQSFPASDPPSTTPVRRTSRGVGVSRGLSAALLAAAAGPARSKDAGWGTGKTR